MLQGVRYAEVVSNNVRSLLKSQGLTRQQLADRANISRGMVGFVIRGERKPGIEVAARIANALGVSIDDLVAGQPLVPFDSTAKLAQQLEPIARLARELEPSMKRLVQDAASK